MISFKIVKNFTIYFLSSITKYVSFGWSLLNTFLAGTLPINSFTTHQNLHIPTKSSIITQEHFPLVSILIIIHRSVSVSQKGGLNSNFFQSWFPAKALSDSHFVVVMSRHCIVTSSLPVHMSHCWYVNKQSHVLFSQWTKGNVVWEMSHWISITRTHPPP